MTAALVIAAHGTRDAEGEEVCRRLTARVQQMLPQVQVVVGFVELSEPSIPEALSGVLAAQTEAGQPPHAVVVPLMLGTGNHVRADIPGFIEEVRELFPQARIDYARHLGPEPALTRAVVQRLQAALAPEGEEAWQPEETSLVFCGRGALVPEANADHVRLARMHFEQGGWQEVTPCFIQVTGPSLPEGLDRALALGAKQIVVMGHWLFPGRLRTWTFEQSAAWQQAHPEVPVRVAEVIGDCDELASIVVERYREMRPERRVEGSPTYVSGLLLEGRPVVVVGGGAVSERRVPVLVEAGARVRLVSPEVTPALAHLADSGAITWEQREWREEDLDGAWYVQASTDDPAVNRRVAEAAEARHTFCVRADDAWNGSAWTPATTRVKGATVAVISNRDPRRSRAIRDEIHGLLGEED